MTATALLLALLAAPGVRCEPPECRAVVSAAQSAGARYGVPPAVLVAVCLAESGCDPRAVGWPRRGGVDLGAWQLHLTDHRPATRAALAAVAGLEAGAAGAGYLLARSRRMCRRAACPCPWAHYNWAGRARWCRRVRAALRVLTRDPGTV